MSRSIRPVRIGPRAHRRIVWLLSCALGSLIWFSQQLTGAEGFAVGRQAEISDGGPPTEAVAEEGSAAWCISAGLECPAWEEEQFLLVNNAGRYTLLYDTAYRQAAWVAYLLTRSDVSSGGVRRTGRFRRDPEVVGRGWPSASDGDYARSGFDRGHLLPSADRNRTVEENRATFLFSNVSPQYPALNRGVWKSLEEQVRRWAAQHDSVFVVTGPELGDGLPRRGAGGVGVPAHYFKALLVRSGEVWHACGWRIPNAGCVAGRHNDYAMSIDSLEAQIGYNLFALLPPHIQQPVEASRDTLFWK